MRVSIHQPQYLAWLPYFQKIAASDCFIVLDSVDFEKNGRQNRNQVKTPQGATWLTVPVHHRLGQKIIEVRIDNSVDWRRRHLKTIENNYRRSPAFKNYIGELANLYDNEWECLVDLNLRVLEMMLRWFSLERTVYRSSQMAASGKGSRLVLALCQEVGATTYISGIGGRDYLVEADFAEAGIGLVYQPPRLPESYPQQYGTIGFLNDLSALDLILNCGPDHVRYTNFEP
jgi:hypothetical protein